MRAFTCALVACLLFGCQDGGSSSSGSSSPNINPGPGGPVNGPVPVADAPLIVSAGVENLEPVANGSAIINAVDLNRLGFNNVNAVYDFTTPVNDPIALHVLTSELNNTGLVSVAVAHALDNGQTPGSTVDSLAEAGVIPSSTGAEAQGIWLSVTGDGFARLTLQGQIGDEQILAVRVNTAAGSNRALIRLRPGVRSKINIDPIGSGNYPHVLSEQTIYSSNSWLFGLPAIAMSFDDASILSYEGDRANPTDYQSRYEMRLQVDGSTGAVTGGAMVENSPDSGNWRDHEIAGLFNVLARVHAGASQVTVDLSFDRGASFGQTHTVPTGNVYTNRLVQVAMADDYSIAVVFWRNTGAGSELVLLEGQASQFDTNGSPTFFTFLPLTVLHNASGATTTPAIMGVEYSDGGDLVIGYGHTTTQSNANGTWSTITQYRCAVRLFGSTFNDSLVEQNEIISFDPSVALVGSGATMQIFYAYETADGITLRTSGNAGSSWSGPLDYGDGSCHLPTVLVREQSGQTRVDLLYIGYGAGGSELMITHWDDFGTSSPASYRLTTSNLEQSSGASNGNAVPGAGMLFGPPQTGLRITQLAWLGYDAVLDGDDVVICYIEQTYDAYTIYNTGGGLPIAGGAPMSANAVFQPASPPPLAPGLTQPVPAPDPDHMNQMRVLRID